MKKINIFDDEAYWGKCQKNVYEDEEVCWGKCKKIFLKMKLIGEMSKIFLKTNFIGENVKKIFLKMKKFIVLLKMSEIFLKMKKFIGENFENTCEDELLWKIKKNCFLKMKIIGENIKKN